MGSYSMNKFYYYFYYYYYLHMLVTWKNHHSIVPVIVVIVECVTNGLFIFWFYSQVKSARVVGCDKQRQNEFFCWSVCVYVCHLEAKLVFPLETGDP